MTAYSGTRADYLRHLLAMWWSLLVDDAGGGIFKLVIAEVRNFSDLADCWVREVLEPGRRLIGELVREGMNRGEFRRMNPDVMVHSLVLPMIMACLH